MTLPYSSSIITYIGNGLTFEFPFDFKVWHSSHLKVIINPLEKKAFEANFSVILGNNGGIVTCLYENMPLPAGWKLSIMRNMPLEQLIDLITGTRFDPQVIEFSLDYIYAILQQHEEEFSRVLQLEVGTNLNTSIDYEKILQTSDRALNYVTLAKAWAMSENSPDANNLDSKSAKTWAMSADESVQTGINKSQAWAMSDVSPDVNDVNAKSAKTWAMSADESVQTGINISKSWAMSDNSPDINDVNAKSSKAWAMSADESIQTGINKSQAWAMSDVSPDVNNLDSKSAKTWASVAKDSAQSIQNTPNTRLVLTTSQNWIVPATGTYKATVVGGGGCGGNGGSTGGSNGGLSGTKGGDTSFADITVEGGHSGAGGGSYGSGSGGDCGEAVVEYLYLVKNDIVNVIVGSGGIATTSGVSPTSTGQNGSGGARGGTSPASSQGAGKGNSGAAFGYGYYSGFPTSIGGSNNTGYGGGGGGSFASYRSEGIGYSAVGGDNGEAGAIIYTGSTYAKGGNGGIGVVILEFYTPPVTP